MGTHLKLLVTFSEFFLDWNSRWCSTDQSLCLGLEGVILEGSRAGLLLGAVS